MSDFLMALAAGTSLLQGGTPPTVSKVRPQPTPAAVVRPSLMPIAFDWALPGPRGLASLSNVEKRARSRDEVEMPFSGAPSVPAPDKPLDLLESLGWRNPLGSPTRLQASFRNSFPGASPTWISTPALAPRVLAGPDEDWAVRQTERLEDVVQAALPVAAAGTPPSPPPGGVKRTAMDELICSLSVAEWDLAKVLQALSVQTHANLLLQAPPDTKLTISLTKVPLADMLRHICAVTNLQYLRVDNTYIVADAAKLEAAYPAEWYALHPKPDAPKTAPKEATATHVYIANYVSSQQVVEALKGIFGNQGLTVNAGPSQVTPKIVARDTGAVTGITTGTVSAAPGTDTVSRVVILQGPQDVVDAALEVAKALDVSRPQVSIGVAIYDINNDAVKDLGLSWTFGDIGISEGSVGKGLNFGDFTRVPLSFAATISALEKNDKAKQLASPNISVLDGEQAFILIGNRINYPVLIGYTQLNTPIFDKETEKVGIYLQVAASVSDSNEITLSLYPQVSSITGFLQVNGASYPQIATREAQTTLRVPSGQTIVMGGLLRDEEISNMERVPILSDIPILGELFKRRKTTKTSSQVLIAITPTVIPPKTQ
ncbi:MAG: type II and III secretion system protein [Fimbriimonadaceae bacterium]|nr:hypothetical protein [Chthonomonadaceae bacterium]MCO5296539.1 type II and III secretion system protein [Fimbriimonadaceae bacterium]